MADTPQFLTQSQKDIFALAETIGALQVIAKRSRESVVVELAREVLLKIEPLVGVKVSL